VKQVLQSSCGAQKFNPGGVNSDEVGLFVRFDLLAMDTFDGSVSGFSATRCNPFGMLRFRTSIPTRLSVFSELFGDLLRLVNVAVRSQCSLVTGKLLPHLLILQKIYRW